MIDDDAAAAVETAAAEAALAVVIFRPGNSEDSFPETVDGKGLSQRAEAPRNQYLEGPRLGLGLKACLSEF